MFFLFCFLIFRALHGRFLWLQSSSAELDTASGPEAVLQLGAKACFRLQRHEHQTIRPVARLAAKVSQNPKPGMCVSVPYFSFIINTFLNNSCCLNKKKVIYEKTLSIEKMLRKTDRNRQNTKKFTKTKLSILTKYSDKII